MKFPPGYTAPSRCNRLDIHSRGCNSRCWWHPSSHKLWQPGHNGQWKGMKLCIAWAGKGFKLHFAKSLHFPIQYPRKKWDCSSVYICSGATKKTVQNNRHKKKVEEPRTALAFCPPFFLDSDWGKDLYKVRVVSWRWLAVHMQASAIGQTEYLS